MTTTIKQHTSKNYYISLETKNEYETIYYEVTVCPLLNESECGHPIKNMTYSKSKKKNAYATFNRYKKAYT